MKKLDVLPACPPDMAGYPPNRPVPEGRVAFSTKSHYEFRHTKGRVVSSRASSSPSRHGVYESR